MQLQSILSQNVVSNETVQTANAENLHSFLETKSHFRDWIKNRITKYGFIENQDYIKTSRKVGNATAYDYHITLDMAKELCMVENNDRGREARRYFIECEKQLKQEPQNNLPYIYQLERENTELKRTMGRMLKSPTQTDGNLLDLIGQVARFIDESKIIEEVMKSRRTSMENFMNAFVRKANSTGLTEQSQRKSERVHYGQLKLQY